MSEVGKELWEVAAGPGQPPKFNSPEEMWNRALEYFEWCGASTLTEEKAFSFQGQVNYGEVQHMRAMTQSGLCIFLNISVSTWHNYKSKAEYLEVTRAIEETMREQKLTGAAAGLLNANIIARDLGLKDASEIDHTSSDGSMSPTFDEARYKAAQDALKGKLG
ncbi:putative terminase small subunit [Vibrio phage LP.1]|nr:putative terminase small subunit [Vibrio phage LP.1]